MADSQKLAKDLNYTAESAKLGPSLRWTDEDNKRRGILIDKKFDGSISSAEQRELDHLNDALDKHLDKIGSLPTEHLETLP